MGLPPAFFLKSMKLLFENINQSYGGFDSYVPCLVGASWIGLAEVDDKVGKEIVKEAGVSELSDSDFEWYKKKLGEEKIAYRQFTTLKQEPNLNPNASYAEEGDKTAKSDSSSSKAEDPKDLIEVDAVEVEKPIEESDSPRKPKSKKAK